MWPSIRHSSGNDRLAEAEIVAPEPKVKKKKKIKTAKPPKAEKPTKVEKAAVKPVDKKKKSKKAVPETMGAA